MKYSASFLVTAETALYFSFLMLVSGLAESVPSIAFLMELADFFPMMLVFLGLVCISMFFAEMLEKIPVLRAAILLVPALSVFVAPVSILLTAFVPPFLYAFITAASGRFLREHWRYLRTVGFLLRLAALSVVISLANDPTLVKPIILAGIFFLFCIVGLRKLRTGINGSPSWRIFNFAEVFLPLSGVGLLTAGVVFGLSKLKVVFEYLMMPLGRLLAWLTDLMHWLFSHTGIAKEIEQKTDPLLESTAEATRGAIYGTTAAEGTVYPNLPSIEINWRIVLAVLLILATGLGLILFFRNKPDVKKKADGGITGGKAFRSVRKRVRREHSASTVERIRICYRRYLDMLSLKGLRRMPGDTSLDVLHFSEDGVNDEYEARLRELYLKARYLGRAEKAEAAEAESLLELLRKN